ncbi:MAG: ABC transporter ATP-binding protein [Gemmatimonadales bacterium]|nr:ABC transporter ATP-binding protein [Gemmatimonadales bacterium]
MTGARLRAEDVQLSFKGVMALRGVSVAARAGELLAVIGPNGSGKTSFLNCVSGFYRPDRGRILFEGTDLCRRAPHAIARLGVARTFQNIALYSGLTAIENLLAARHIFFRSTFLEAGVFIGRALREEVAHRRVCEEIMDLLDLQSVRDRPVGMLSYGWRKRVELGRALALEPRLLLLDEPMAGMNVEEKEDMARSILAVMQQRELAAILVEHDLEVVMDIADRLVVFNFGEIIAEGVPAVVRQDARVVDAYLGRR